jgi:hypothetical protein
VDLWWDSSDWFIRTIKPRPLSSVLHRPQRINPIVVVVSLDHQNFPMSVFCVSPYCCCADGNKLQQHRAE